MLFRLNKRSKCSMKTLEALFRDLRNQSVKGLLSQQTDMLRTYMKHVDATDVAMQMPTGSGKTLVGLLIADNNTDENAGPDPWWVLGEDKRIVFEDYTDCKEDADISARKVRQATGHPTLLNQQEAYQIILFHPIILSPARSLSKSARPLSSEIYYREKDDFTNGHRMQLQLFENSEEHSLVKVMWNDAQ